MIQMEASQEPQTLDAMVQEYSPGVFRYLRSMVGEEDVAKDLLQDTFLKLRPHAAEAGKALIFTAARSCALDYLRRKRTRQNHVSAAEVATLAQVPTRSQDRPDHQLDLKRLRLDLLGALEQLPEDQRTVFHLSEIEGLSYAEISQVLDVSPGTIASRKHHAVRKLRTTLRRRGHGA